MFSRESQEVFKGDSEDGHFTALGGERNRSVQKAAGGYDAGAWGKSHGMAIDVAAEKAGMQKRGENRNFATYANPQTGEHLVVHKPTEQYIYDNPKDNGPKTGFAEDVGSVLQPAQKGAGGQNNGQMGGPNGGPGGNNANSGQQQGPDISKAHSAVENQDGSWSVLQSHDSPDKATNSPSGTHSLQAGKDGQWTATPKNGDGEPVQVAPNQIHVPKAQAKVAPAVKKSEGVGG